jgi:small subunit ribosomal protein S9
MSQINIPADLTNLSLSDVGYTPAPAAAAAPAPRPLRAAKPADKRGWWWGTGRRKSAIARIRLKPAQGEQAAGITIETQAGKIKSVNEYFCEERDRVDSESPLRLCNMFDKLHVVAKMHGGGFMGQAQALRLAIARAIRDYDPTTEGALRDAGYLTRDSRKVERKKYGQAGARRRFQFSKR